MDKSLTKNIISIILVVTNQLNLLLCLVNDVLDMKMIEQGKYSSKLEIFNPKNILEFIIDMFQAQTKM